MQQENFLQTIRRALGREQGDGPASIFTSAPNAREAEILRTINTRTQPQREEMLATLATVAKPLYVDLHIMESMQETAEAIGALIQEKSPEWGSEKQVCRWDHPLINALGLENLPALKDIPVITAPKAESEEQPVAQEDKTTFRQQVEQSFIGITSADYCAAFTVTLALRSRPGHARSVSLVPSIHVAVIKEEQLLANLEELYTLLKWDEKEREEGLSRNLSLISGPSKTGDIELIMVHGAHGPRELHLFVIRDV